MKRLYRDNVAFAYEDVGSGSPPLLFVHGWACNHNFFAPQIEYFSGFHRVIAADLCGHGASDAPQRQYTVPEFADDLAWLCGELGVERAVLVGHSMGGVIALQLAATHPELSAGVCLIDSVVFPSDAFIAQLKLLGDQLAGDAYIQTLQLAAGALFIETDDPVRKAHVLAEMAKTSQHVAVPAFRNHLLDYDASRAARECRVPVAYIAAGNLLADLGQFKQLCPQLVTAQTLGSGHFSPLEVPEQVNAMLERFVNISLPQDRGHAPSAFRDGGSLKSGTNVRNTILEVIGNTPAVRLRSLVTREMADVIVKLEYYNPTGSYKDRMALAMIEGAEARGSLRPGMRVVEYAGGSTGSSLALVCAIKGYRFVPVSSDGFAKEKLQTMRIFGADLRIISSENGQLTPELFRTMIDTARKLSEEPETYYTDQFNNTDAIRGYMEIGNELLDQAGPEIAAFCGGVGTAGMLMGVSRALKARGCRARIVALEPASSPVLTCGKGGPHRVEGIGVGFRPPHLKDSDFDEARTVDEQEARAVARRLAKDEGIFAGTSSAMNVVAALQLAAELGPGKTVATVAVDSGFKYLAGDLYQL